MKRIFSIIAVLSLILTSCQGPQGPPGFDGFNGQNGAIIASSAFEIEVDFFPGNNFEIFEPYGFQVLPSDVTLVYILWDVLNGQDVWRLVPQTVQFADGTLVYNYDFTQTDVSIFLEGTTNFAFLNPSYTQNQIFRVVVVPADNVGKMDFSNLEAVMARYDITTFTKR